MQTTTPTNPRLPSPVANYFALGTTDPQALTECFTEDAVVIDERQEHRGRAAIAEWNTAVRAKYSFTTEVLAADGDSVHTTIRARVTGTFPGSPIELRYLFTLNSDLIARLEIAS